MNDEEFVRLSPDPERGLNEAQVKQRIEKGLVNQSAGIQTKSVGEIIRDHFFTFFNLLNLAIGLCILISGSYKNALFLGVVASNLVIGVFQEVRAKQIIDRLSVLASPKAWVIRDGKKRQIAVEELVLDDIIQLHAGEQICADAILLDGQCEINESLLTGESDAVSKNPGDLLYSGSFVASGSCRARVEHIGNDNYANQIANESKYIKQAKSEMMTSIRQIIAFFGSCVIPIGLLLFFKELFISHIPWQRAVVLAAASMIGMIPEGLVLLTSAVLAVSVIRLSRYQTLVHDLYCIETLARVDTLCVDKTGTITEGSLTVDEFIPMGNHLEEELRSAVSVLMGALEDNNPTAQALRQAVPPAACQADELHPFSSARKWSGAYLKDKGSFVLGAAEVLGVGDEAKEIFERCVNRGQRVLAVGRSEQPFQGHALPDQLQIVGLVIMSDVIRPGAEQTFAYFREQGVDIKVISGDNPTAVARIAQHAGLQGALACVDARTLDTPEKLEQAAETYTTFGRVTPQQKLELVKALKRKGHTVAMTGDGVNDVLALKEADCSIAMAAGSDAARTVSNLVLLHSDFSAMPVIVREGRRSINNLQRSASLFIVKNIFTMIIALVSLVAPFSYPFQPIQFSLISMYTIGIPSFLLALESNNEPLRGSFYANVLSKSLPAALCVAFNVLTLGFVSGYIGLVHEQISTLSVLITAFTQFLMLLRICLPFTRMRLILFIALVCGFGINAFLFRTLISFTAITWPMGIALAVMVALTCVLFPTLCFLSDRYFKPWMVRLLNRKKQKKAE